MVKKIEKWYFESAEYYWWLKGRRDLVYRFIKKVKGKHLKILDVGCSCGTLVEKLEKNKSYDVYGIDNSKYAVQKCIEKRLKNVKLGNAVKLPYKNNFFDVVIASDVLEHIKSDKEALEECKRVLKRHGYLIIGVPAFSSLWSRLDSYKEHKRRYDKVNLIKLIESIGMKTSFITYWNFFSFLPITIIKILMKNEKINYEKRLVPKPVNELLLLLLKIENILIINYGIKLPFGISILTILKK